MVNPCNSMFDLSPSLASMNDAFSSWAMEKKVYLNLEGCEDFVESSVSSDQIILLPLFMFIQYATHPGSINALNAISNLKMLWEM